MPNYTNPFETAGPYVLEIPDPITGLVAPVTFVIPSVNNPGNVVITAPQIAASLNGMNTIFTFLNPGFSNVNASAPDYFNQSQFMALANTIALFGTIIAGANTQFTTSQLQDIVVADEAILNIYNLGTNFQYATTNAINVTIPFSPPPYTCVVNDQFAIYEQPGTGNFYVSNAGDATNIGALSFATSESYSDDLQAVDALNGTVILFGRHSMEYWYDSGTQQFVAGQVLTFPYQRVEGVAQTWGLAARFGRVKFMNGLAFVGQQKSGTIQVLWLAPGTYIPIVISSSDVEETINTFKVKNDCIARTFIQNKIPFLVLTFVNDRRTFMYDGANQLWSELQSGTLNEFDRHLASLGETFHQTNIVSDWSNGNTYILDPQNQTDNGYFVRREVDSVHIHNDGNSFSVAELWLDIEVGVGNGSDTTFGVDPQIMMSFSTDNGKTFVGEYWKPLGGAGAYKTRVAWYGVTGVCRDVVFKFVVTSPVPFNIVDGSAVIDQQTG
jgi:Phage stabilisation protein